MRTRYEPRARQHIHLPSTSQPAPPLSRTWTGRVPGRSMIDDEHCRSRDPSLMQPHILPLFTHAHMQYRGSQRSRKAPSSPMPPLPPLTTCGEFGTSMAWSFLLHSPTSLPRSEVGTIVVVVAIDPSPQE
ncbi:hypothetical protein CSHISOI_05529 [Colletotrichum shisoi]|uniref:Uncharacterized protein n=1 Tax=Colletotrichum shisoi TaxID=2078593 RepID=A0A5Q4BSG0_9PEZI|nr:hypothetical protein CSHISOI_05529 [Colletotrichum shisoi]